MGSASYTNNNTTDPEQLSASSVLSKASATAVPPSSPSIASLRLQTGVAHIDIAQYLINPLSRLLMILLHPQNGDGIRHTNSQI